MTRAARPLGLREVGEEGDPEVVRVGDSLLTLVGFLGLGFLARNAVGVEAVYPFSTLLRLTSSTLKGGLART